MDFKSISLTTRTQCQCMAICRNNALRILSIFLKATTCIDIIHKKCTARQFGHRACNSTEVRETHRFGQVAASDLFFFMMPCESRSHGWVPYCTHTHGNHEMRSPCTTMAAGSSWQGHYHAFDKCDFCILLFAKTKGTPGFEPGTC